MATLDPTLGDPAPGRTGAETLVVATVSAAHAISHFAHLIVPPMFPWLRDAFALSNTELGFVMTVFFVVSCAGQAASGFLVDRVGAVPVLIGSLATIAAGAAVLALGQGYATLLAGAALTGLGNAPFHPVDYSILNSRIATSRLGNAYAFHGVAGSLGWAVAPVFMVGLATWSGWRTAFAGAALLTLVVMLVVIAARRLLAMPPRPAAAAVAGAGVADPNAFGFLRLPAVWLSFAFFFVWAMALGGVQTFGTESARLLHGVPVQFAAACLTAYMIANACGTLLGGRLVRDPSRADRIVGAGFLAATALSLTMAVVPMPGWMVPVVFAAIGLGTGVCGPSRDLLIRAAAPPGATGRVYGVVYSGLDIGMACAPLLFGAMMDRGWPSGVWIGIALTQAVLIASVLKLGTAVRRAAPAAGAPA